MDRLHRVSLELLRHGPAHNQLLSPLTNYLALCGNNGAATVQVPYEHQEFLGRIKALRYGTEEGEDGQRHLQLGKTAEEMAAILAAVPGLVAGLGSVANKSNRLAHLRIVLSASELAMLPFELAKVPSGCAGGEGNSLLLQTVAPVCMTRNVRSVADDDVRWPRTAKILFIAAGPGGMDVPVRQHLQALIKAIKPWIKHWDPAQPGDREKRVSEILTVLPRATLREIETACAMHAYTHVHILAHGIEDQKKPGSPFGVALHGATGANAIDIVSGDRLASALRPIRRKEFHSGSTDASPPAVVTLASCDSGNVATVVYNNGASFAHALHQAGVPLVIASQFPLSKAGSVHMPEVIYESLLWGEDPRISLQQLRGRLHALSADTHDWASLVAYEALPADLEHQLTDVRYERAKAAIGVAMNRIDMSIDHIAATCKRPDPQGVSSAAGECTIRVPEELLGELDTAASHMPIGGEYATEGRGILGSTEKRKAEALFRASLLERNAKSKQSYAERSLQMLEASMRYYQAGSDAGTDNGVVQTRCPLHWVLSQYLSLQVVLGQPLRIDYWELAKVSARVDLTSADEQVVIWGHATLAELYLLLLAEADNRLPISHAQAQDDTLAHIKKLYSLSDRDSAAVYSTRRQFSRYSTWWGRPEFQEMLERDGRTRARKWSGSNNLLDVAESVVATLGR